MLLFLGSYVLVFLAGYGLRSFVSRRRRNRSRRLY
jgi:hypothetical protein